MTPKIIDCFIFYNEIQLLYYRLNFLYDFVDYFVIIEANQTFVGNPKESFFSNHNYLFKKFSDKIIYINVNLPFLSPNIDYNKNEQWSNEIYQRNCIQQGIQLINKQLLDSGNKLLHDNDMITITDVDEIINPNILANIKKNNSLKNMSLEMDMYYYNLQCKNEYKWYFAKIVCYEVFKIKTPQELRWINFPQIKTGGWHLSYFGNEKVIQNKIKQFSHQEHNNSIYTDINNIKSKINNGVDLFDRPNELIKLTSISIEKNDNLPLYYDIYLSNYCI
jgi:beta-1,4-mannosyl-glycoprotein beta-1,4-N-acetylglucosaminyltransferase